MNCLSINTACYGKRDINTIFDSVKAAGFEYVELPAMKGICEQISPDMDPNDLEAIKNALRERNLKVSGICAIVDYTAGEEEFKWLVGCLQLAEIFETNTVITLPGSGPDRKRESALEIVDILLDGKGIRLELEPVFEDWPGKALNRVLENGKYKNIGINYDTANVLFFCGYDPNEDIETCIGKIESIHLKDKIGGKGVWNFPAVGTGELPLKQIVGKLINNGYKGFLTAEIEFTEEGPADFNEIENSVRVSFSNMRSYL